MEIKDKRTPRTTTFDQIPAGTIFMAHNYLYIKIDEITYRPIGINVNCNINVNYNSNAFNLTTAHLSIIKGNDTIQPVSVEITIKENLT